MLHAPQRACTTAGVHPIKHAFAEWHIAPVTRKTPIFRPMSRTFKLPGGGGDAMVPSLWKTSTRCFHAPLFVKIVPELSYESKLLQTRYRRNRMFVLRGLREKREREREKKKKKKKNTYASFENNDSRSSSRSIDRYRELVSSRGVTSQRNFFHPI